MRIASKFFRRTFHVARIVAVALMVSMPVAARANIEDARAPLRLIKAKQFDKALVALDKLTPQNRNQWWLHHFIGWTHIGRAVQAIERANAEGATPGADAIKYLQQSRPSLLKAQQLAGDDKQKESSRNLLNSAESALCKLDAPLEEAAPPKKDKE